MLEINKKQILELIEMVDGVTVVKPQSKSKTKKSGLDEAMEDAQKGDTIKNAVTLKNI